LKIGQAPADQFEITVQVTDAEGQCRLIIDTPASYPSSRTASRAAWR